MHTLKSLQKVFDQICKLSVLDLTQAELITIKSQAYKAQENGDYKQNRNA